MTRKVTIPIYNGDDFERISELYRKVTIAERQAAADLTSPPRMGGLGTPAYVQEAKDAYDAYVDEASERAEMWVLNSIGHEEFRDLLKTNPPRKITGEDGKEATHPDDEGWDVDTSAFPKALLLFVDSEDDEIRTVAEPQFDSPAALRKRLKRLSAGEFDSLWVAAMGLNSGVIADPKLSRFSPDAPRSSET